MASSVVSVVSSAVSSSLAVQLLAICTGGKFTMPLPLQPQQTRCGRLSVGELPVLAARLDWPKLTSPVAAERRQHAGFDCEVVL